MQTISFIGGGNMAASLVGGLVADGRSPDTIWVSDVDAGRLDSLAERFGVHTSQDNARVAAEGSAVVLAVKPQVMAEAAGTVAPALAGRNVLVVSIAAGVRTAALSRWLGPDTPIVRTMPNTPALLRCGATALFANPRVSAGQKSEAESILRAAGLTLWVEDEALLDAVTAVSGSGPAYYFLLMELMEEAGAAMGLDREAARMLTLQTALGAARMALESSEAPGTLRERVTSPGGTTEAALRRFDRGAIRDLVDAALRAARDRSVEIGDQPEGR